MPYIKLYGELPRIRYLIQDKLYNNGYAWECGSKYTNLWCDYLEYYKRDGKLQLMAHFCASKPEYFTAREFLEMINMNPTNMDVVIEEVNQIKNN